MTSHKVNDSCNVQGLTEMSARAVLRGMQLEDEPATVWFGLEEHIQRLIFPHLWEQCREALEIKRRAKAADVNLYTGGGLNYRLETSEDQARNQNEATSKVTQDKLADGVETLMEIVEQRVDLKCDPYFLKKYFQSTWSLLHSQNNTRACCPNDISWAGWDLYRADADASLEVYDSKCDVPPSGSMRLSLRDLISSQLLLYRLVAVFGIPSTRDYIESHGTVWGMVLMHEGDNDGRLAFEDFKGGAHVAFQGNAKASERAVQLVEWLVGDNIPHGSYYRLLGTAD